MYRRSYISAAVLSCLILIILFYGQALGQATGNVWFRYDISEADSFFVVLSDSNSVDTIQSGTSGSYTSIDTLIDADDMALGVNNLRLDIYYAGNPICFSAEDIFNNVNSGTEPAKGFLYINYNTAECDTVTFVHEVSGTVDSSIYTSVYGIDTSFECSDLGAGIHNFITRFKYSGASSWVSANDIFHNSDGSGAIAVPSVDYVTAYIDVMHSRIYSLTSMWVPRSDMEAILYLVCEQGCHTTGGIGVVPLQYVAKPDSGRFTFHVPANTLIEPDGSYYELYFKGRKSSTLSSTPFKKFVLDTIPDPINIMDAEEVN